jgi:predicted house-cleaning noncanonical NTP pyrophosphatase (MazG superfamily)
MSDRHGKLVRDRIPELVRADGFEPFTRVLSGDEYQVALRDKLAEEVDELLAASPERTIEEMADVLEVLRALATTFTINWDSLEELREHKLLERGGFEARIWMETDDSPDRRKLN